MDLSGIFPKYKYTGVRKSNPLCFCPVSKAVLSIATALVCIAATFFMFSCGPGPEQRIIASFDDHNVMVEELRSYMQPLIYVLQDRPYVNKYADPEARKQALEYYVVETILADRARKRGLQQGETFRQLIAQQEKGLARQYLYRTEILEKSKVEEAEAHTYYEEHKQEFINPEVVVYQRIFFHVLPGASQEEREKTLETARSVLDQLAAGESFQKLMEQYSTDPPKYQATRYVLRGDNSLSTPILHALFATPANQHTALIDDPMGYGIYLVTARYPSTEIPFQSVQSRITNVLEQRAGQNTLQAFAQGAEKQFGAVQHFRAFTDWPEASAILFEIGSERVSLADVRKEIAERFGGQEPTWEGAESYLEGMYLSRLLDRAAEHIDVSSVPELERNVRFYENYALSELWLNDQVSSHVFTREDQMRYYKEHPEYFRTKAKRECSIITCYAHASSDATPDERIYALKLAEQKIQHAYDELVNGVDFAEVARKYSEDRLAKNGGYIGYVTEPSFALFDINVKKLSEGEFSSPIGLSNGYMIIKLESVIPREVKPFEEVQDALLERMQIEYRHSLYESVRKEILDAVKLSFPNGETAKAPQE
jgi:parvulin-like peptidyl-prolyl isomerase